MTRAILFDLDGVVYNAESPIPGAAEALAWVRSQAIPHLFVTNTTSRGRDVIARKLERMGIPAGEDQILTPCEVAADWLRGHTEGPVALFVRPAARSAFAGLECLTDSAESGARHVVIGDLGEHWDFATLNRAFRLLHANPQARLIALGMTRFWQAHDGISLDVAPFVAALEHAADRKALVFGKPARAFFEGAVNRIGSQVDQTAMIGDDIVTDVGAAQEAGLTGVLLRTGKFRPSDIEGAIKPDAILDSIASIPEWWRRG